MSHAEHEHAPQTPGATQGKRRVVPAVAVASVLLALAVLAAVGLLNRDGGGRAGEPAQGPATSEASAVTEGPAATEEPATSVDELAAFTGSGDDTTEAFEAAVNWELRWKAEESESFSIELLAEDGASRGQVVQGAEEGSGTTFVSEEGEFKLEVSAAGDWSITVVGASPSG